MSTLSINLQFYFRISPYLNERFINAFNAPSVKMASIRGNHFVLINSMAMEGDDCSLCRQAEVKLMAIAGKIRFSYVSIYFDAQMVFNVLFTFLIVEKLRCFQGVGKGCVSGKPQKQYSRPIILQVSFPHYLHL